MSSILVLPVVLARATFSETVTRIFSQLGHSFLTFPKNLPGEYYQPRHGLNMALDLPVTQTRKPNLLTSPILQQLYVFNQHSTFFLQTIDTVDQM